MRDKVTFEITNVPRFKEALLQWSQQFNEVLWLDSNDHKDPYSSFDALLGVEANSTLVCKHHNAFEKLKAYRKEQPDWMLGYLSYDLKNDTEQLASGNQDHLNFPELFFFQPKKLIIIREGRAHFHYLKEFSDTIEGDFRSISTYQLAKGTRAKSAQSPVRIRMRIFKDKYFSRVQEMLSHIHRGDIYEANFCQEFYMENAEIDPLHTFQNLNAISYPPFATYLKFSDKHLLSASPERYLKKEKTKVISQPIKGTAKRSMDSVEDLKLRNDLKTNEKERAENIMIVDLVRNDLSKSATRGSVKVEELCEVYSFAQVHQMISTISAELPADADPVDIIKESFPMGSMTGAPKISAMKIIEKLEASKRGLYSGAVGYFTPEGDFDFNVVIRSILYNATKAYVSYSVGSAITAKALPEREYEECLLKAKAMKQVLENG